MNIKFKLMILAILLLLPSFQTKSLAVQNIGESIDLLADKASTTAFEVVNVQIESEVEIKKNFDLLHSSGASANLSSSCKLASASFSILKDRLNVLKRVVDVYGDIDYGSSEKDELGYRLRVGVMLMSVTHPLEDLSKSFYDCQSDLPEAAKSYISKAISEFNSILKSVNGSNNPKINWKKVFFATKTAYQNISRLIDLAAYQL